MNKLQEIVFEISGYRGLGEAGARNDHYYECESEADECRFIEEIADYMNLKVCDDEIYIIQSFLNEEKSLSQNERYHEFKELSC